MKIRDNKTAFLLSLALLAAGVLGACSKSSSNTSRPSGASGDPPKIETNPSPQAPPAIAQSEPGTPLWKAANLPNLSAESQACVACHQNTSQAVVQQWGASRHFRANVGCYECHQAHPNDADAFMHFNQRISVVVSPTDCGRCHEREVKEFAASHHAQAAKILGSLDNVLAEVVEGTRHFKTAGFPEGVSAAAMNGCWQCHGSEVKVLEEGKLDPATWPNTGIGRLNPDGSRGSCAACHSRHKFSVEQARHPDTCGKCHLGPDHPQAEIYNESKHGIAFHANVEQMNMANDKWVVGQDYNAAPTCATCHMSATPRQGVTHDVGERISWNNRPAKSVRPEVSDAKMGLPGANLKWEVRRNRMTDVCVTCHSTSYTEAFYLQYDALIDEYHKKYADPGLKLMALAKPLLKPAEFSNKLDFIWFELWHHEGRRARHAASMQGPDYTHWHGTYEIARNWYSEFVPELEELIAHGKASGDAAKVKAAEALHQALDEVLNSEDHRWYLDKMSPDEKAERTRRADEFKKRYAQ